MKSDSESIHGIVDWAKNPHWCNLCNMPIASYMTHTTRGNDAHLHRTLETLYHRYVNDVSRTWNPLQIYQHCGHKTRMFETVHAYVHQEESIRRAQLLGALSQAQLPVLRGVGAWGTGNTCWWAPNPSTRAPGYSSLRPAIARALLGLLPSSCGILSDFLHDVGHENHLDLVFQYLRLDSLFPLMFPRPQCLKSRTHALKNIADDLYFILKRPLTPVRGVMAAYALHGLAAECVSLLLQEHASALERAWGNQGRPCSAIQPKEVITGWDSRRNTSLAVLLH